MSRRVAVAERNGIALVELSTGDTSLLDARDDGAFEVDQDSRPHRYVPLTFRLGVLHAGELVGVVSWHAVGHGPTAACEAWNVGIGLLPAARGRGTGSAALRLLTEYLFTTTDVDRVEASTDRDNLAAQHALANAGLRAEGTIRGAQLRGGRRRDLVAYSILRTDHTPVAPETDRAVVAERDGVRLAEPAAADHQAFYAVSTGGEFTIDRDDRPRVTSPTLGSLLSVLDAATGQFLGGVSWHAVDYGGTLGCSAWNIGIALAPSARGRGVGTTAQRLLVEYLFATTEVDRVEASTDVDNVAEQRALEKAGFRREGVLRGAQVRGGMRRDLVHYGRLREWE
jgi:RimJ/RimL family protein N-acetyltransferase